MPRLKIISLDRSQTTRVDTPVRGYFSILAPKGTKEPRYFPAGSEDLLTQAFGTPSSRWPHLYEVINFNSEFGVWVSAPEGSGTNYTGGVYVTRYGLIPFYQVANPSSPNFLGRRVIPLRTQETFSANQYLTATLTAPWCTDAALTTLGQPLSPWVSMSVAGQALTVDASDDGKAEATTLFNVPSPEAILRVVVGGTPRPVGYVTKTGANFKFFFITTAPAASEWAVVAQYDSEFAVVRNFQAETAFLIAQKSPTAYHLEVVIEGNATTIQRDLERGLLTFSVREERIPEKNEWLRDGPYTVSLDPEAVDGFRVPLFLNKVIPEDNPFIYVEKVGEFPTEEADITAMRNALLANPVVRVNGVRALDTANAADRIAAVAAGFQEANRDEFRGIRLFVDITGDLAVNGVLANLRQGRHRFATFVQPVGRDQTTVAGLKTARNQYAMNEGFAYVINEFLVKEPYTGTKFFSPLVGPYARKLARAVRDRYGGWATMWYDSNGLGGELGVPVLKAKFSFTEDELDEFDNLAVNPIVLDPKVGPMVTSHRSGKSPLELSDLSWLGHSMALDLLKEEIFYNVMLPQIGKPNEPFWQNLRQQQVQNLLEPRLQLKVFSWAKVEVAKLNTPEIMAQRKFRIGVAVKVTPFSEAIELIFTNLSQSTTIEEVF